MRSAPSSSSSSPASTPTPPIDVHDCQDTPVVVPPTLPAQSGIRLSYLQCSDLRTKRKRTPDTLTSVLRKTGTMRLDSYPSSHQQLSLHQTLCTDCVVDCKDTDCPIAEVEFLPPDQCTDSCIIVPCDKETVCFDDLCLEESCDMQPCDGGDNCTGYDDFLQCCTDDHAYYGVNNPTPSNVNWDNPFDNFFTDNRNFGQPGSPRIPFPPSPSIGRAMSYQTSSSSTSSISTGYSQNSSLNSSLSGFGLQNNSARQPGYYSTNQQAFPSRPTQQGPGGIFACRWSGCNASFPSMNDLVGHVNLAHLRPANASRSIRSPQIGSNQIQCQWDHCSTFPPSTTFSNSSAGLGPDALYGLLENHVMSEHLPPQLFNNALGAGANQPFAIPQRQQGYTGPQGGDVPFHVQPQPPHHYTLQGSHANHSHSQSVNSSTQGTPRLGPADTNSSPEPEADDAPGPAHDCAKDGHTCRWVGCNLSFPSCDALTAHITMAHVGSGRSQYSCHWAGCTRHGEHGFSSKQKILRHLQSHTGHRPFQCQVCKQNFSEAATLQQHIRRHTQEKPFVCDFPGCGKAFAITGALTIHKRMHNGERPFKCPHCDKAFAESSNLSKHLKTHTGDRPYKCPEPGCDKCFARPDQLTRHANVHTKRRAAGGS